MLPTTFRGEPVFLLPYLANWAEQLTLAIEVKSDITRALSGMEARHAYGATLRANFTCSLFLEDADSAAFRAALRVLGDKRILMPLWPLAHLLSDGQLIYTDSVGNILAAEDGSILIASSNTAPLPPLQTGLWLTFGKRSQESGVRMQEESLASLPEGSSPDSCLLTPDSFFSIHESPLPPELFQSYPNTIRVPLLLGILEKLPEPRAVLPALITTQIKFRDTAPPQYALRSTSDPSAFRNPQSAFSTFPFAPDWGSTITAGAAKYEITYEDIGQGRAPNVTYYPQNAARPFEAVFKTFDWPDLAALVAFFHAHEGAVKPFTISHPLDGDILARFAKPSIEFSFLNAQIASSKISFLEVPDENEIPAGETPGVTIGALAPPAYLYRFRRDYPGLTVYNRYTGYERNITAAGELYLARGHWDYSDITDSTSPEQAKAKVTSSAFDGNPLLLFSPPTLEVPLWLEILKCRPDADGAAASADIIFTGRVKSPEIKGKTITIEAGHILQDLERDAPAMLIQGDCNYDLYSKPCGLLLSDWTITGSVARYDGHALTLDNLARSNGAALFPIGPGSLASGRLWFGSGENFQNRSINNNTAIINGEITLTLSHPLNISPSGRISLAPGCPGTIESCKFFGNYARYGGFPHVPVGNPSLKLIKDEPKQGKK